MRGNSENCILSPRKVLTLFFANIVAFLVVGLAYVLYSKLLSPEEFGLYSIALVIGSFGVMILDGGLKNTIIKLKTDPTTEEEGTLFFILLISSFVLLLLLAALETPLVYFFPKIHQDFIFLALFAGIFLISYPFILIPTAFLERKLEYGKIAWIESISLMLERGAPACMLLWSNEGMYSFIWGLLLGRLFRVISLNFIRRVNIIKPSWGQVKSVFHLIKEGSFLQTAVASSIVRDNLHVLIVGPFFGKEWVGYYAWALQMCLIASQVFVQIAARVSIPVFAQARDFVGRWKACSYQIRLLTILTGPVLLTILLILPGINTRFFGGKWEVAIGFLPLLFIRMFLAGISTTPVGALVMVHKGGRSFASANIMWTFIEILLAGILLVLVGPKGLAWSYSIGGCIGLWIFLSLLGEHTNGMVLEIIEILFKRPSVVISIILVSVVVIFLNFRGMELKHAVNYWFFLLTVPILVGSYLSEKEVQRFLRLRS